MEDPTTATVDQIVDQAREILKIAEANDNWSAASMKQLVEWLVAYIVRLANDVKGKSNDALEVQRKEIACWAENVARFFPEGGE